MQTPYEQEKERVLAEFKAKGFVVDACKKCDGLGATYDLTSTAPRTECDRCNGTGNEKEEYERLLSFLYHALDTIARSVADAGRVEKEKLPVRPCINAEMHMFGRRFDCEKTKGKNDAIAQHDKLLTDYGVPKE